MKHTTNALFASFNSDSEKDALQLPYSFNSALHSSSTNFLLDFRYSFIHSLIHSCSLIKKHLPKPKLKKWAKRAKKQLVTVFKQYSSHKVTSFNFVLLKTFGQFQIKSRCPKLLILGWIETL